MMEDTLYEALFVTAIKPISLLSQLRMLSPILNSAAAVYLSNLKQDKRRFLCRSA
jgi:hypothetical protein